jgi:threonylcarbamoyladenosine tRNA methylthiotransferase MtaB
MARGSRPTVGMTTVGCKLNQYETEGIAEAFEASGFRVVPFTDCADAYVVNTCTVTGRSDYRSRQMLRRASRLNPSALIVATGCYAQREPAAIASMPEVDLVVGNTRKHAIAELVADRLTSRAASEAPVAEGRAVSAASEALGREAGISGADVLVGEHGDAPFRAFDITRFRGHTRAFLKIQDGCDRRCAYCAVPDARGPARSRPPSEVLAQATRLVQNSYREIVLTGVHIGSYGVDLGGPGLAALLDALTGIPGLVRLRLGSIEPMELTAELASTILGNEKICRHLHVPLESGSDATLASMGRSYTRDRYADAIRRITEREPLTGLGTDVMVGFPGESDRDFEATVALIEELPFTYLHVFSFSPRIGTAAAEMEGRVPGPEKKRRSRALRELGRARSLTFRRRLVGTRLEVLVEDRSDRRGELLTGLSSNYVRVDFEGADELRNRFVTVTVDAADEQGTRGTPVPGAVR